MKSKKQKYEGKTATTRKDEEIQKKEGEKREKATAVMIVITTIMGLSLIAVMIWTLFLQPEFYSEHGKLRGELTSLSVTDFQRTKELIEKRKDVVSLFYSDESPLTPSLSITYRNLEKEGLKGEFLSCES